MNGRNRATELFERFIAGGEAVVDQLIAEQISQELFIDYKRVRNEGANTMSPPAAVFPINCDPATALLTICQKRDLTNSIKFARVRREMKFTVSIYQDEGGVHIPECASIPSCFSEEQTQAEAIAGDAVTCTVVELIANFWMTAPPRQY